MRKVLIIINLLLIIIALIIFYPRSVEHGVIVDSGSNTITMFLDGKEKTFKASANFPKYTVVNFKYNLLKAFSFKTVNAIEDRIMLKSISFYDLEKSGKAALAKKHGFYSIDKNNTISVSDGKSVIVGKTNVKSYKNKKGELKTFIVSPIDYSTMRVGLSNTGFSSVYHNSSEIECIAPAKLYSIRDNFSEELPKGTKIFIKPQEKEIKVIVNDRTILFKNRVYLSGNSIAFNNIKRGTPSFIPTYNGIFEFSTSEDKMTVINEINLEDYLSKVVPSEMPSSGGVEALKCQAIAARTYAISDMIANRYADLGFHVDDSTKSQVYNNIEPNSLATEAVKSTKGHIMTYNNIPIDAKYYSTSAGTGVDYKDVWFRADGTTDERPYIVTNNYLIPKTELPKSEDEWLNFFKDTSIKAIDSNYPYFRWKVEYSTAGLTAALNKTLKSLYTSEAHKAYLTIYENSKEVKELPELKDLQDIKVIKRGAGGIAIEVSFIFSNATVNVRGDSYIRSSIKCNEKFTNEETTVVRHKGSALKNVSSLPSAFFSPEKKEGGFILYGGGFGHGAGMSQYGAIELSKQGMKHVDILNTFYKNIKIESIY